MIALNVVRNHARWFVGWPYKQTDKGYVLPTEDHRTLVEWWPSDIAGPVKTRTALLLRIDNAVRRCAPPIPFQLVRMGEVIRQYDATESGEQCLRT